jgi:hypothetical protein
MIIVLGRDLSQRVESVLAGLDRMTRGMWNHVFTALLGRLEAQTQDQLPEGTLRTTPQMQPTQEAAPVSREAIREKGTSFDSRLSVTLSHVPLGTKATAFLPQAAGLTVS